jgi:hypothetical protein
MGKVKTYDGADFLDKAANGKILHKGFRPQQVATLQEIITTIHGT